jgi:hypothetical protein
MNAAAAVTTRPNGVARTAEHVRAPERRARAAALAAIVAQPLIVPHGPGNSSLVDVFTLLTIGMTGLWVSVAAVRVRMPYAVGVALTVMGGAVAGAAGPLPATALVTIAQDVVLLVFCAAITTLARTPAALSTFAGWWARSAMIYAAVLVAASLLHLTVVTGVVAREGNRALFTFGDPNYAATYWVLSIFVAHACLTPRRRLVRLGGYALLIWALLLSESNGGVVAAAVGAGVLLLCAQLRRRGAAAALATLLVIVAAITVLLSIAPLRTMQTWARQSGQPLLVNSLGRSNESSAQRSLLVGESWQLFKSGHYIGIGPAATKQVLQRRGYPYAKEAHDDYLAAITERGPLGALGLAVLFATVVRRARPLARAAVARAPAEPVIDGLPAALPRPGGLIAALVVVALAGTYYEMLHFRFSWLLFAFVATYGMQANDVRRRQGRRSR